MSAADMAGHLSGGWGVFYDTTRDADAGRPHLRTYHGRQAEKFYETFAQPLAPQRPGKVVAAPRPESLTWGMGGTAPQGRLRLQPFPAADFKFSQKRVLRPAESAEMAPGDELGRKGAVYNEAGTDVKTILSKGFLLEDQLQRKQRVPEEARTDKRTIHRLAPPGLKGYMGAEYSNDFFLHDRNRSSEPMRASNAASMRTRKSFNEKRSEEEVAEQVALVARLYQPLEDGDEEDEADDAYATQLAER